MPIVSLELVEDANGKQEISPVQLQEIVDVLGDLFDSEAGGTWIKVSHLPRSQYAENRTQLSDSVRPTFVTVLKADPAPNLSHLASQIASAIATCLQRPLNNTHVLFEPPARHRIAFGGNLVE